MIPDFEIQIKETSKTIDLHNIHMETPHKQPLSTVPKHRCVQREGQIKILRLLKKCFHRVLGPAVTRSLFQTVPTWEIP